MALMHNAIIRALNSIYKQAPHVEAKDNKDFIDYALCWYEILYSMPYGFVEGRFQKTANLDSDHHESEEEFFFPAVEQAADEKGIMDTNVEQHRASICAGLRADGI